MSKLLKNLAIRARQAARSSTKPEQKAEEYTDTYLIDKVRSADCEPEAARVGGQYLHVSSLISACIRRHVIAYYSKVERLNSVNAGMRIVWALGRAAEHHVRTQFIKAVSKSGVVGKWKCKCGHLKVDGLYDDILKCPKCDKKADQYTECLLLDTKNRITGSPDLLYIRPDNKKLMVVECKSMNKASYDALTNPSTDHVLQAMAYNELLRINGADVDDSVTIVYVSKDFSFKNPYKEFRVRRSQQSELDIQYMWKIAAEYAEYVDRIDKGVKLQSFPKRWSACPSSDCTVAKGCDCVGMCFSLQNG